MGPGHWDRLESVAVEQTLSEARMGVAVESISLAIIGTGYVGLVTGTCFAEVGHNVICVDCDAEKVRLLQEGGVPIYEPGLEELIHKNTAAGRLQFTDSTREGVERSDVVFIAVP